MSIYKPTPMHNPLKAPASCMCAECSREMLALRCPKTDPHGRQCGDYKDHRGSHTLLVDTIFLMAAERASSTQ